MEKIAIVFCGGMHSCPYIEKYLKACKAKSVEYDVLFWDRTGEDGAQPENYYNFAETSGLYIPKRKKLFAFLRFGRFLRKMIRQKKYDKLIVLTTLPAILCYNLLVGKYKSKYIFDFRDVSFEYNELFLRCVQRICDKSFFTCISSPGFQEILGERNLVPVHNFRYADLDGKKDVADPAPNKINIVHMGITRGDALNKQIADVFGNDDRFRLYFIGRGNDSPVFTEYAKNYSNITVMGTYDNAEKEKYISDATMLLYYYPSNFGCKRALANKYYDGIIYKKPLLGNVDTYSGMRLMEKGVGISVRMEDKDVTDKVYEYISNLDVQQYSAMAEKELTAILQEDKFYLQKIDEFLDS